MKKGIAIAGNLLVDLIKMIDVYPVQGMLCNISGQSRAVGGIVPNVAIDIAKIDGSIPLYAVGRIGNDGNGGYILNELKNNNIDITNIIKDESATSYSDVMTLKDTGARTFFHYRGANAKFEVNDINLDKLNCDILHLGYALLLDKFDVFNEKYGTEMARALCLAKEKGIKTSIDVVSEASERFSALVTPCLKYCDYIIINEIESSLVSKIPLRNTEGIIEKNLSKVCKWFFEQGVNELVCIHFPEGAAALNKKGEYRQLASLKLPDGYIKGTVGAGDAFCAGMLYCQYKGFSIEKSLRTAINAAACNLSQADSVSGMKDIKYVLEMDKNFERGNGIRSIL